MRLTSPRLMVLLVLVTGLAGTGLGLVWMAAIALPYQDATPDMLERQSRDLKRVGALVLAAFVVSAWAALRLVKTRRRRG